jgi:hypothetical protein
MRMPSKEMIESLRERYPKGTRVELVSMDDPYTNLKPGDKGRVDFVDDGGTLHCSWDNGSHLGVVYGVDRVRKIADEKETSQSPQHDILPVKRPSKPKPGSNHSRGR